jgi:hypothetical protein
MRRKQYTIENDKHAQIIELDGESYEIEFKVVSPVIVSDGIGEYEYWGAKGFDPGNPHVEDYDIKILAVHLLEPSIPMEKKLKEAVQSAFDTDVLEIVEYLPEP